MRRYRKTGTGKGHDIMDKLRCIVRVKEENEKIRVKTERTEEA